MKISIACFQVFGSGYGHISLKIDGKKIGRTDWPTTESSDGFQVQVFAEIPAELIRKAKVVEWQTYSIPGGSSSIKCSGKRFIKIWLGCEKLDEEPSRLIDFPRTRAVFEARENAKFFAQTSKKIASGEYRIRQDGLSINLEASEKSYSHGCVRTTWRVVNDLRCGVILPSLTRISEETARSLLSIS